MSLSKGMVRAGREVLFGAGTLRPSISLVRILMAFAFLKDSFTRIPMLSERFSSATALQFHHLLPSLDHFVSYIQKRICKDGDSSCLNSVSSLQSTSYLDIDYDAISHVLSVNAFWPSALQLEGWTERLENAMPEDKIEVGVLGPEKATTPEELSLGGYLTVVGEDEKPGA